MSKTLEAIELFAGIGGFQLAGKWVGIETIESVEINPFCQKVLKKNFPNTPIYDDVTDEMKYAAQDKGLDEKALRAQLIELRSKINRELAAIVVANARIE